MRFLRLLALACLGVLGGWSAPARAAYIPIGSNLDFVGGLDPVGGNSVGTATGVDIRTNGDSSPGTPGTITIADTSGGAFSAFDAAACPSFLSGGCGTLDDLLSFQPNLPVADFIQVSQTVADATVTSDFTLTSLFVEQIPQSGDTLAVLILSGAGTLDLTGYDPTPALFTLTAQGSDGDVNTSFSASIVAEAVPEPASLLLLSGGLFALGLVRHRGSAHRADA